MWANKLKKLVQDTQIKIQNEMPGTKEFLEKATSTTVELGKKASRATYDKCSETIETTYAAIKSEKSQDVISKAKNGITTATVNTFEGISEATIKTSNIISQTVQDGLLKSFSNKYNTSPQKSEDIILIKKEDVNNFHGENEEEKIKDAIEKLKVRDKFGLTGEALGVVASATAGTVASGTLAAMAGATTIFGSTTLGSMLGGVFVATTPVGWIIGSAAAAAALGYGITKLAHSGGKQDQVRHDTVNRLNKKIDGLREKKLTEKQLNELKMLIPIAINNQLITEDQANRMINLINSDKMDVAIALKRIKSLKIHVEINVN